MPPRGKAAGKPKASDKAPPTRSTPTTATTTTTGSSQLTLSTTTANNHHPTHPQPNPESPSRQSLLARSQARFDAARPYDALLAQRGRSLAALSRAEQTAWLAARIAARLARHRHHTVSLAASPSSSSGGGGGGAAAAGGGGGTSIARLACGGGAKTVREVWRAVSETGGGGLPIRAVSRRSAWAATAAAAARADESGLGDHRRVEGLLSVGEFEARLQRKVRLGCLEVESRAFRARHERERRGESEIIVVGTGTRTGEKAVVTEQEVLVEKRRRREMAELRKELYGGGVGKDGKLAADPEWDDVVPVVLQEPEGALATIAYPDDYAEAMAYLRAVMRANEYSPRCLRLTEHIIAMNPSHYTVWLYRAANVFALKLPILDEIQWLNGVALENLKNYQIWHHRHLLVENYFPSIADDPDAVARFAASEREFLRDILAEDTKNYHVWSYRSYLVGKLGMWDSDEELRAIEAMIDDDVRNNSAWSHRFFVVFSNPKHATPGVAATEADPKVPPAVVDREIEYAKDKIELAPQNQSGWNYLRGVLVKSGRKLSSVEEFASGFVQGLGEGEEGEEVQSTHALDLLAEIYAEKGDKERADLSLRRLGQKWDRIRLGYWEWRRKCLEAAA